MHWLLSLGSHEEAYAPGNGMTSAHELHEVHEALPGIQALQQVTAVHHVLPGQPSGTVNVCCACLHHDMQPGLMCRPMAGRIAHSDIALYHQKQRISALSYASHPIISLCVQHRCPTDDCNAGTVVLLCRALRICKEFCAMLMATLGPELTH